MGILEVLAEEAKKYERREGRKEARKATLLSTAKKLLKEGVSVSLVHKCTGIPKIELARIVKRT
ncbi:MAG: hypothetical protein J7497_08285 [Chitinophagaceae bacterium]|nr:hypothetical protein [Chitinophagaceae bacterium]